MSKPWDWSSDNRVLLFSKHDPNIYAVDVTSGHQSLFLSRPGYALFQAKFSPDRNAVALNACDSRRPRMECWVFVALLKSDVHA